MKYAVVVLTLAAIPLLGLVTFVQLLYLESMRLRPRDLPALKFFKDTLEDRLGMKTEQGAGSFTLIKHTTMALLGIFYFAWLAGGAAWTWNVLGRAALVTWVTLLVVAFAAPQIVYRRSQARWLLPLVPLLRALAMLVRPFHSVLDFCQSLFDLADDTDRAEEHVTPAENIEALISAGTEEGLIEEKDKELIQSVVEFGDTVVREVMTPRPNMVTISAGATLEDLRQLVISEQFSRIPVYEDNIDQIIGFVHVRDMFEVDESDRKNRLVRGLVRETMFVPETKPASELMREMQEKSTHMVIVIDEYGNTAGLATMEDLLEVIIGEIRDEHEPDSDVTEDGRGGFIVSGNFDVARIGTLFNGFHPNGEIESTTIGGLLGEWLGRVPKPGETVDRGGIRVEVLAGDDLHVGQVRISKSETVPHE